jgi:cellulose synthase/poly-beta-1,6-N-acetylglucosamine synthase-like glycosyltransferase
MLEYDIAIISLGIAAASFIYYFINSYMSLRYKEPLPNSKQLSVKNVTIVVPVYKENVKVFTNCIKAIKKQGANFIVIGDSSNQPYRSITTNNGGKFILNKERGGKRKAISTAMNYVNTKFVLFVDSDTMIPAHALTSMLSKVKDDVGGVGTAISIKLEDNWVSYCSEFFQKAKEMVFKAMSSSGNIFVISGRCCLYRVEAIKPFMQSDQFIENKVFGKKGLIAEDMHITSHILKSGYKAVIDYNVNVVTESQKDIKQVFNQLVRWARGGYLYFFRDITEGTYIQKGALYSFEMFYIYLLPLALVIVGILRLKFILSYGVLNIVTSGVTGLSNILFLNAQSLGSLAYFPMLTLFLSIVGTSLFVIVLSKTISKNKLRTLAAGAVMTVLMFAASIYALLTVWNQGDWLTR